MNPISDLYTTGMEKVMPFLLADWQIFLILVGGLFLAGAVLRWRWVCDPQGSRGIFAFTYRMFGEKGYRVVTALAGVGIMVCGGVLWVLS